MAGDLQAPADACKGSTSRSPAVKYPKGPATGEPNFVGTSSLAKTLCLSMTMLNVPTSSRASALLQEIRHTTITCGDHDSVGAGLLAKAWCLSMTMVDMPASSRASALLHGIRHHYHQRRTQIRRSRLAGEALRLAMTIVDVPASSRASALLHGINTPTSCGEHNRVAAGLLAKPIPWEPAGEALCLAMTMVDVPASSRASALLRWINTPITSGEHKSVGAGLLAKALCLSMTMVDVPASSRASALLHGIYTPITCGKPHPWEPACWRRRCVWR